ncbi:MAG: iron-containing alcohol dehydrogenase [Deltaproteobacteria bacterium]|nr:iron-containing alcohol dehydrogenase [Deltaproteobacteria bacterium]
MKNFEYFNPVKISFGRGSVNSLGGFLKSEYSKVMLITGGGSVHKNGSYEKVMKNLAKREVVEFSGVEANPDFDTLMKAVELARKEKPDLLLALGGGSVIDGTKFIAGAVFFEEDDPWNILRKGLRIKSALPIVTVLTLPATGSEVNDGAVISRRKTEEKMVFKSPLVFPEFSIIDPDFTVTLPRRQLVNGIIDSFVHVCEQYLTVNTDAPLQYALSESILKTLVERSENILREPPDLDARGMLMWCSSNALNRYIGTGVVQDWTTHMIGHELTALAGMDHAATLAVLLPGVLKYKINEKLEMLVRYAGNVWGISGSDPLETVMQGIEATEKFFSELGAGVTLSEVAVDCSIIDRIVERFEKRRIILGENSDIYPEDVRKILESRCGK